jgi:hypothetical protein
MNNINGKVDDRRRRRVGHDNSSIFSSKRRDENYFEMHREAILTIIRLLFSFSKE